MNILFPFFHILHIYTSKKKPVDMQHQQAPDNSTSHNPNETNNGCTAGSNVQTQNKLKKEESAPFVYTGKISNMVFTIDEIFPSMESSRSEYTCTQAKDLHDNTYDLHNLKQYETWKLKFERLPDDINKSKKQTTEGTNNEESGTNNKQSGTNTIIANNVDLEDKKQCQDKEVIVIDKNWLTDTDLIYLYFKGLKRLVVNGICKQEAMNSGIGEDAGNLANSAIYTNFINETVSIIYKLSLNNNELKKYNDKTINIYKAYTIGATILGETLQMLESKFSLSNIIFFNKYDNTTDHRSIDYTQIDCAESKHIKTKPNTDDLVTIYSKFRNMLFELDCFIKVNDLTKKYVESRLVNNPVCKNMDVFLKELAHLVDVSNYIEDQCLLLRVFCELRDCIYQCMNFKSQCAIGKTVLMTFVERKIASNYLCRTAVKDQNQEDKKTADVFFEILDRAKCDVEKNKELVENKANEKMDVEAEDLSLMNIEKTDTVAEMEICHLKPEVETAL